MKRYIPVFALLLAVTILARYAFPTHHEYPKTAQVIAVCHASDLVIAQDNAGQVWSWFGTEDWSEGDWAALLMHDNGTPEIKDDRVIAAQYAGDLHPMRRIAR